MKINPKSQKGAVTMVVLVAMLFLTAFVMSMYIRVSNKAQISAETTKQIEVKYNNLGEAESIYAGYLANGDIIPIYSGEVLMNMDNDDVTEFNINGKIYIKDEFSVFVLMEDITIDASKYENFTQNTIYDKIKKINFDGLGHKITVTNLEDKTYIFAKENSWLGVDTIPQGVYALVTMKYKDGEENTAVIPKGFKVSNVASEQTISTGLVIQDKDLNEFVWIPVTDGTLDRTAFLEETLTEYTDSLPTALENSVAKYKGFYIGRYESGVPVVKDSEGNISGFRTNDSADTITDFVVKKGVFPYNSITCANAKTLVASKYTETSSAVVANLPYGAQWDEMLNFIVDNNHSITDSTDWGNYLNATFTFSGLYSTDNVASWIEATNKTKPTNERWTLTTGASEQNRAKNIYDIAGNDWEWTHEASSSGGPVLRGGSYDVVGDSYPATKRSPVTDMADVNVTFRCALYIK